MPGKMVTATTTNSGGQVHSDIQLEKGVDPRVLVMMAHDLLVAAEQKGVLTESVAVARPLLQTQVQLWGMGSTPTINRGGNAPPHAWVG